MATFSEKKKESKMKAFSNIKEGLKLLTDDPQFCHKLKDCKIRRR